MKRDDVALEGLLRELGRAPDGDEAFVRRVLTRAERGRSRRALVAVVAASAFFAAFGVLMKPAPTACIGFARQASLVPEARSMRVLAREGDRFLLLGEVPMGAQARVPAGTPLLLQAIGADGMALWTDRNEIRLETREVRSPATGPVVALVRKCASAVEYGRQVKPILEVHCSGCHAEAELLAAVKPFESRRSALLTEDHAILAGVDRRVLALWIDLGAPRP